MEFALSAGRLALCAEAVGAMSAAHELLLDYLKVRTQFGATIRSFQALQHRAVDLLTEIKQARSITIAPRRHSIRPRTRSRLRWQRT